MSNEGLEPRKTWAPLGSALADIVDAVLTPLALLTSDLRFLAVNRAYCEIVGRTAQDLVGRDVFEVFPDHDDLGEAEPGLRDSLESAMSTGQAQSVSLLRSDMALVDGGPMVERYWHVSNVPIPRPDGTAWLILNNPEEVSEFIDERTRLEAVGASDVDGAASPSRLHAVDSALTAEVARLQNLNDLASALVGATTPDAIGRAILTDGMAMVGAVGGSFVSVDQERFTIIDHRGIDAATTERWSSFKVHPGADPFSDSIDDGLPRFLESPDALVEEYPALADDIDRQPGHRAWAVLPLHGDEQVCGVIGLIFDEEHPFTTAQKLVMYTLTHLATQAWSRARLVEEQSLAMRSVEEAFQPSLDQIEGVDISDLYRPASVNTNAGGDWYDIIDVTDRCTMIAIGDVANHGPVAVGEMARTRATLHALALQGLAPDEIATQVDLVLTRVAATFTTSVIAILDTQTDMLTWTTAGHPHPILRSADGSTRFLTATHGAPLGAGMEDAYESSALQLERGDTVVLYTDGLVERSDEPIDDGLERLRRAVEEAVVSPDLAHDLFDRLIENGRHSDDVALLTLHLT